MKRLAVVLVLLSLAPAAALARQSVLVELFTAQGCGTCTRANASVARLIDRPGVVALTWSVDYWDYLGWKDTFAQPAFTERQRAYDTRFGLRDVSTPQIIVGGVVQGSGDKTDTVDELIKRARRQSSAAPRIASGPSGRIAVGSGRHPRAGGEVWLVRYNPAEQVTEVKAGDNRGASVTERNVVRQLVRLGSWSGLSKTFKTPPTSEDGLITVVVVQENNGGPVIAVATTQDRRAVGAVAPAKHPLRSLAALGAERARWWKSSTAPRRGMREPIVSNSTRASSHPVSREADRRGSEDVVKSGAFQTVTASDVSISLVG
jgi:hypothetical protein